MQQQQIDGTTIMGLQLQILMDIRKHQVFLMAQVLLCWVHQHQHLSSTVAPGKSNDTFNGHSSSATYASPPSVTESSAPVLYLSLDPAVSQTSSPSLHIKGPKPLSTFQHPTFGHLLKMLYNLLVLIMSL